jgi:hypothetical protein
VNKVLSSNFSCCICLSSIRFLSIYSNTLNAVSKFNLDKTEQKNHNSISGGFRGSGALSPRKFWGPIVYEQVVFASLCSLVVLVAGAYLGSRSGRGGGGRDGILPLEFFLLICNIKNDVLRQKNK